MLPLGYAMNWGGTLARTILRMAVICYVIGFIVVASLGVQTAPSPQHGFYGLMLAVVGLFLSPIVTGFLMRGKSAVSKLLYVLGMLVHFITLGIGVSTGVFLANIDTVGQETINRIHIQHRALVPLVLVFSLIAICFELFRSASKPPTSPALDSGPETNNPYQPPGAG